MGALLFGFAILFFLLGMFIATPFVLALVGILVSLVVVILAAFLYAYIKESISKDRRPPVAGVILNQLVHFNKLFDYQTALARKHSTYRLIAPSHSEIYTVDPANIEHILKTNFLNYGKVILVLGQFICFNSLINTEFEIGCFLYIAGGD